MKTGLVKFREIATKLTDTRNATAKPTPVADKSESQPDPVPEPRVVPPLSRAASELTVARPALDEASVAHASSDAPGTSALSPKAQDSAPPSPSKTRVVFKMKGHLKKQGESGLKSWRRRYFRLVGNALAYYHENGDERPINSIDLTQMST
jgi:hypothetical protein